MSINFILCHIDKKVSTKFRSSAVYFPIVEVSAILYEAAMKMYRTKLSNKKPKLKLINVQIYLVWYQSGFYAAMTKSTVMYKMTIRRNWLELYSIIKIRQCIATLSKLFRFKKCKV